MPGSAGLAQLHYETPEFLVLRRGTHVLCAVTGDAILLEDLVYWSAEYQEAYRSAVEATAAKLAGGAGNIQR